MANEYLTMAEIEKRYPNEWVLIDRPVIDEWNDVTGGRVEWHHQEREEFDRHLPDHPLKDSAILYAGVLHPEPLMVTSIWTDDSTPG